MGMTGEQAYVLAKKYTEETAIGMGAIKGEKGDPGEKGFSPTITENADNTDKIYKLDITTADSSFTTPNLKGADGTGGTGASTWSEISDKPFETLSTDFYVENGELKVVGGTGGSGEENTIESIFVNGTHISPDENKNVNITVPEAYDDTALSNRVKTIEDDYAKSSDIPSLSGYATESYVNEQISNIPGVDLTDYATKTYVGEQITNAEHLKREIVTVLPSDTEASDNIIYMLKVESATGNDKYQEYMKIDGTVQLVGDTSVDLTDYAKKTDIPTTLPANGGNSDTVNNHTVETNVPENAVFTDTIYDDTEVKGSIVKLNSNLSNKTKLSLELGDIRWKDGGNIESNTWKRSGFVKVTPNTKYTFNRILTSKMNIIGYKENKTVISDGFSNGSGIAEGVNTVEYEFITTPTTNYIRICIENTDLSENITLTNNGIGNTVVELVEDVAELKNDSVSVVTNASGANILVKLNMTGKSFIASVTDEGNRNNYIVFIGNYATDSNPILNVISSNVLTKGSVNKFGTVEINGSSVANVRWKAREL